MHIVRYMHTNNEYVEDIAQELVAIYHAQAYNKKQKTDVIWANLKLEVFSCVKHAKVFVGPKRTLPTICISLNMK